jgi:hypothetical protein
VRYIDRDTDQTVSAALFFCDGGRAMHLHLDPIKKFREPANAPEITIAYVPFNAVAKPPG